MLHWHFELQIANANKQQQGLREVLAVDGDGDGSCWRIISRMACRWLHLNKNRHSLWRDSVPQHRKGGYGRSQRGIDGGHEIDVYPKNPNPSLEWYWGIQFHPDRISQDSPGFLGIGCHDSLCYPAWSVDIPSGDFFWMASNGTKSGTLDPEMLRDQVGEALV